MKKQAILSTALLTSALITAQASTIASTCIQKFQQSPAYKKQNCTLASVAANSDGSCDVSFRCPGYNSTAKSPTNPATLSVLKICRHSKKPNDLMLCT